VTNPTRNCPKVWQINLFVSRLPNFWFN